MPDTRPDRLSPSPPRRGLALAALAFGSALLLVGWLGAADAAGKTADFNFGWKFHLGDVDGAEAPTFNAADWPLVDTPHDWAIGGPFNASEGGYAGKLPWRRVGWYRKFMTVDRRDEGSQVYLDFDGVMSSPRVYVNGQLAGEWDYGYTSFRVDVTPLVRFGRANVVAVRVDNRRHGTRWYPGAGIFRKVTLTVSPPVHLSHNGTTVRTPSVSDDAAEVVVSNEIESHLQVGQPVDVQVAVLGPDGRELHASTRAAVVQAGQTVRLEHAFRVDDPQRWDIDRPSLYRCVTRLRVNDQTVEQRETSFGIRSFRFDADEGFVLNGRRVPLQGVNLHHDLGALGAAYNDRAMERRLRILQEMGVNAVRTSHNPPAAAMLDLCDKLGLLVWDELFDKWDVTADYFGEPENFGAHMERHAKSLVRRDRNHPSVIAWSIGNEILNQPYEPHGKSRDRVSAARQAFLLHDDTRPIGMACHIPGTADSDILAPLDLVGWNYQERYKNFRKRFPNTPIIYSETASAVSSRGQHRLPLPTDKCGYGEPGRVNAYEMTSAAWGDIPEVEFDRLDRDTYLAGEFVWTGFDYLGEPTPFEESSRSSYFGVVDLAGLPKDRYYLYRSRWRPDTPTLHVSPHWTWPGREGQPTPVTVYTNGDQAELLLNGRSLGMRRKGDEPVRPPNLVARPATAVSTSSDKTPLQTSSEDGLRWAPSEDDASPWLSVDLGAATAVKAVYLRFPRESKHYAYRIEVSSDGSVWSEAFNHPVSEKPRWGGVKEAIHPLSADARLVRITFGDCAEHTHPAIEALGIYESPIEARYFRTTYHHRLRWNDVAYEPGELKVVAYRDGQVIAQRVVRTAGPPAGVRLSADRRELTAAKDDLCYVAIDTVDQRGNACPTCEDEITISVAGPGRLVAVCNGDPESLESFHSERVRLFGGRAVAIISPDYGIGGEITLTAESEGLAPATLRLTAHRR